MGKIWKGLLLITSLQACGSGSYSGSKFPFGRDRDRSSTPKQFLFEGTPLPSDEIKVTFEYQKEDDSFTLTNVSSAAVWFSGVTPDRPLFTYIRTNKDLESDGKVLYCGVDFNPAWYQLKPSETLALNFSVLKGSYGLGPFVPGDQLHVEIYLSGGDPNNVKMLEHTETVSAP